MTAQPPAYVLLCDESGNTGADYLNEQQPVFIYAGILLEAQKLQALRSAVGEVDRLYPQASEKKGADLTKDGKGRRALAEFVRSVLAMGGKPLYSVVEKKFATAGRIVETYFDPEINPAAHGLHPQDNINRQKVALVLANVPDDSLNLFVAAYHDPTEEAFRKSIAALVKEMELQHQHFLAEVLTGNLAVLHALVVHEVADAPRWGGRRNRGNSTNVPALFAFLQVADRLMRRLGNSSAEVLHHHIDSLQDALEVTWEWGKRDVPPKTLSDGKQIHYRLDTLQSMRFVSAVEENSIRAADFLAAGARVLLDMCARGKPWPPEFKELAGVVAPTLNDPEAIHTWVSPAVHQHFRNALALIAT